MDESGEQGDAARAAPRRRWPRVLAAVLVLVLLALAAAWLARDRLARDLIDDALADLDLPVEYDIASIGPERQVIENIVVGNPASPDLTIGRAVVSVRYSFGSPRIESVRLIRPRLYGRWRDGRASFGTLDRVLYPGGPAQPFRLPDLAVAIEDGRALIRSAYGNIGLKLNGAGNLRHRFTGIAGAVAPDIAAAGCEGEGASLYGRLTLQDEIPSFAGPLRLAALQCEGPGLDLRNATIALDLKSTPRFDALDASGRLATGALRLGDDGAAALAGDLRLTLKQDALVAQVDLAGSEVQIAGAALPRLALEGTARARGDFSAAQFDGSFAGEGLRPSLDLAARMKAWESAADDTLAQPLLARFRRALLAESRNGSIGGAVQARAEGGRYTLILPSARWLGGSGEPLLALARAQLVFGNERPLRFGANFTTGGRGIPRIAGRMESDGGATVMRLTMSEYAAGDARLAIPALRLRQQESGALRLTGRLLASGQVPGGYISGLQLPLSGEWRPSGGLSLWADCITPRFKELRLASLTLAQQSVLLCPPKGSAIVRADDAGLRIAVGAPSLQLAGRLGETPIRLLTGPVGFTTPGVIVARSLDIALGPRATATRFVIDDLAARIGGEVGGRFAGANVTLPAVPLDITRASGAWRYEDGALRITKGSLRLTDRQEEARFNPLVAKGAGLVLKGNRITADALFAEETTGRDILNASIVHDLATGAGHADLLASGIRFDKELQPVTITPLALGTIANARGIVRGTGRIEWDEQGVTSTGAIATDDFDFAAAFGPVKGLAGTLEFTDLLGLETAPRQRLTIAEVNPGIAVENGYLDVTIRPGLDLAIEGGTWPFLGGTLRLEPTRLALGQTETRSFVLLIEGLEAARFVERMGVANITATGIFDGVIPIIFDASGGRVEGGILRSRPPGGNVSYVGELSYRDLSPIANFAFDALKSLDYKEMSVAIDGPLEGEIVTRIRFDGVSQGPGARSNFITRRIAKLPFRFNINIRAPFARLIGSLKSLYDPSAVRDPRELGLVDEQGHRLVRDPEAATPDNIQPPAPIQQPESEIVP